MTVWIEGKRQLSVGKETVWGTNAASLTGWPGLVQDFKAPLNAAIVRAGGFGLNGVSNSVQVAAYDQQLSMDILPQNAALFQFLGQLNTAGSNPYTHTITPDSPLDSATFVDTNVDPASGSAHHTRTFAGCKLISLQLSYPIKDLIKASWSWVGKKGVGGTTKQTLTPVTTAPYLVANTDLKADGVSVPETFNAQVNIPTGITPDNHVFNSLDIVEQGGPDYAPTVTFDRHFIDSDIYDDLIAGAEVDLSLVTTRGANDTFTVNLSDCKYEQHDKSSGFKERQKENVTVQAESWSVVFVDSTSAYTF